MSDERAPTSLRPPGACAPWVARIVGFGLLLALAVGLVVGRCRVADAGRDDQLDVGHDALARALAGDRAAFPMAEEAFAQASGSVVFDAYPVFMLELTKAFEEARADRADPAVRPILVALARGDFSAAVSQLPSIPEDFPGRQHLERAVLELARRKSDHP